MRNIETYNKTNLTLRLDNGLLPFNLRDDYYLLAVLVIDTLRLT